MTLSTLDRPGTSLVGLDSPSTSANVVFTGSGSEYFRLWVINSLLTLFTLGVYSAWAKVNKASYFARNTQLLGGSFDYIASPARVLAGRVLVALFALAYGVASYKSTAAGLLALAALAAVGPWAALLGYRFKLRATVWRGMAFRCNASVFDAYVQLLPVFAIWATAPFLVRVFLSLDHPSSNWIYAIVGVPSALWPWMHHQFKRFQYRHLCYGHLKGSFRPALKEFYAAYATATIFFVAPLIIGVNTVAWIYQRTTGESWTGSSLAIAALGLAIYAAVWPWLELRLQSVICHNSSIGNFRCRARLTYRGFWFTALKNVPLLFVTGGLYWPYAMIAWTRYRLSGLSMVSSTDLVEAVNSVRGDGFSAHDMSNEADAFPVEIGW